MWLRPREPRPRAAEGHILNGQGLDNLGVFWRILYYTVSLMSVLCACLYLMDNLDVIWRILKKNELAYTQLDKQNEHFWHPVFTVQSVITDSLTILRMGGKTHNVTTTEHRYAKAVCWFWQPCQNWPTVTIAMVK